MENHWKFYFYTKITYDLKLYHDFERHLSKCKVIRKKKKIMIVSRLYLFFAETSDIPTLHKDSLRSEGVS